MRKPGHRFDLLPGFSFWRRRLCSPQIYGRLRRLLQTGLHFLGGLGQVHMLIDVIDKIKWRLPSFGRLVRP